MLAGSKEWLEKYGESYREFLSEWEDVRKNGNEFWNATYNKDGQPILEYKPNPFYFRNN